VKQQPLKIKVTGERRKWKKEVPRRRDYWGGDVKEEASALKSQLLKTSCRKDGRGPKEREVASTYLSEEKGLRGMNQGRTGGG